MTPEDEQLAKDKIALARLMQETRDHYEFALLYGRPPAPGEIDAVRHENAVIGAEKQARAALRPGLLCMLKYWF